MVELNYLCSLPQLIEAVKTEPENKYIFIKKRGAELAVSPECMHRFEQLMDMTGALMCYSDFHELSEGGEMIVRNMIDYSKGSVRDDFDFGHLVVLDRKSVETWISEAEHSGLLNDAAYSAFYSLRLALSRQGAIVHINEPLYVHSGDTAVSSQFDYVNPRNRDVQIEMEKACMIHLEKIGAKVEMPETECDFTGDWHVEASVVIPVRNRVGTIGDAVRSALSQVTDFPFNVIVVDNHSTDGTSELLEKMAAENPKLIHLVPDVAWHGIGGCWNEAILSKQCGMFVVQLDSDDVYSSADTLKKVIDKFREEKCAMVVGSYTLTDSEFDTIPPGLIDHREWTPENGTNNALRIHGFGAPRAFYTPVVRELLFPDVSYGEDYAMCLRVSATYKVGRIYDSLYLCRRWSGNSDASLSHEKKNRYDSYKDKIRTWEIECRIRSNR